MYLDQSQYPPSSPSPNLPRPNATPAPFYMAGAEIPPQALPSAAQAQPQQQPPPQQQQYPQREQAQRIPSGGKQQPPPLQTSTSPPPANQYNAYTVPPAGQRPQSNYGPQELSTSVYDSPIAPHGPNSAATYSSSVYSPDESVNTGTTIVGRPPIPQGAPPSAPAPSAPPQSPPVQAQGYQPYNAYQAIAQQQQQQQQQGAQPSQPPHRAYGHSYEPSVDAPSQAPPPVPTGQAPPPPIQHGAGHGSRPENVLTPPPLQPGGPAYDARQTLPSRMGVGSPTGHAPGHDAGQQPQYKAYVPPGATGGPSGADAAPSAPGDYYRTAAY